MVWDTTFFLKMELLKLVAKRQALKVADAVGLDQQAEIRELDRKIAELIRRMSKPF